MAGDPLKRSEALPGSTLPDDLRGMMLATADGS